MPQSLPRARHGGRCTALTLRRTQADWQALQVTQQHEARPAAERRCWLGEGLAGLANLPNPRRRGWGKRREKGHTMLDTPDPADAALCTRDPQAPANPGLVMQAFSNCGSSLHLARMALQDAPVSTRQAGAMEHLRCAQAYLRLAEEQWQQSMKAWVQPDGPPPAITFAPEEQKMLDAARARHATTTPE